MGRTLCGSTFGLEANGSILNNAVGKCYSVFLGLSHYCMSERGTQTITLERSVFMLSLRGHADSRSTVAVKHYGPDGKHHGRPETSGHKAKQNAGQTQQTPAASQKLKIK